MGFGEKICGSLISVLRDEKPKEMKNRKDPRNNQLRFYKQPKCLFFSSSSSSVSLNYMCVCIVPLFFSQCVLVGSFFSHQFKFLSFFFHFKTWLVSWILLNYFKIIYFCKRVLVSLVNFLIWGSRYLKYWRECCNNKVGCMHELYLYRRWD